ncbi:MAG: four helix bundle protein [Candidatus Woykebacteria bacterium RBG_16_43_9]|uniref:Four helix bundle protein n=1 Tax=Candidatus Woykebacteria bacterium RBG_16_43_9 TaxID=1802596 RepID=A0A1G1WGW4_9BACT|nr:MAG: four helix bundle protein [Candidatus Woykebacteria bacterium RBG_16_43_9]
MEHKGYKKLRVWEEAHKLVLLVYKETKGFPREELFGLTSQLRRAVISVPANIVEGQVKNSRRSFIQFLNIANGSLVEVEYYLELAKELNFLTEKQFKKLDEQRIVVGGLLNGLIKFLRKP